MEIGERHREKENQIDRHMHFGYKGLKQRTEVICQESSVSTGSWFLLPERPDQRDMDEHASHEGNEALRLNLCGVITVIVVTILNIFVSIQQRGAEKTTGVALGSCPQGKCKWNHVENIYPT